ncbi:MAG TPA: hypothetical protein VGG67_05190 [Steroidobacteraceae bacterium]
MEAASRPPLEALPDLPGEEPVDPAKARAKAPAAPATAPATAEADKPKDPEQTGLNFVDPEMFLAPGQAASAVPVVNAAAESAKAPEPALELELEDPVVDDLLSAPPPPPPPPSPAAAPTAAAALKPAAAESPAVAAAERAAARVPIAKTASLSAAATKLAAASGATRPSAKPSAPRKTAAAPVPVVPPASNGEAAARTAAAAPRSAPAATTTKPETPAPKLDAPSLASWASAREAAAHKARPTATPSVTSSAPAMVAKSASTSRAPVAASAPATAAAFDPPAAAPAPPAAANVVPPAPAMDRDFIARNQVVERYLSGRLPLKAATEFERYCRDHAEILDQIGLPERVNAGLRLLEAAGKPEPWQESARPAWQKPQVTLVLAIAVVVLGLALAGVAATNSSKSHRIAELQKQNSERALDPATSTREIRLLPSRSGASNSPAITIGGGGNAQLADLKIDESRSPYHVFRVTIDRIDQGRVAVISNLEKDSNGHLRIALNSSALGPGNYQLTLEGLDWRGQPQPDSWVTIGIQR